MKKVISGILVLAFLLCLTSASAANPGTASNPLISKTYMDNTYLPNALSEAKKTSSDNLTTAFLEAKNKLASCSGAESILMRAGNISGYALTDGYERVVFSTGGGVSLRTGGSLIPLSGAVRLTVISGTVIDLSSGSTVSSGSHLTAGARYFCAENTVARYTADSDCVCLVDGYHTSYSNGYLASSQDGIAIIRQPSDATVKVGDNVSFSVDASGVGLEYRWQFKNPNSVWTFFNPANYPSSLTKSLTFTAKAEFNNYSYRCLITNAAGEQVYSDAGQITYSDSAALKINTQPVSLTTQAGGTALFSVSASGSGLTYVWQYRAPGGVWADVNSVKYPTALTSTMTFPAYAAYSGFIYRCVIKDAFGNSVISDTALFIATQTSFAIVSQPEDFSSTEGETASFRVSASGSGLSYQWQYSADGT
ncbi:MAG: hypothetical protein IJ072_05490, partial [Oscillospiraceae bacterium]|nr:hypothetical protein [Oscillospiraceae bacterium]